MNNGKLIWKYLTDRSNKFQFEEDPGIRPSNLYFPA